MTNATAISDLLHEAAETHHVVYRIVDGDDPDWASWYADWLLELSELPEILGGKPVRSHLVHALVDLLLRALHHLQRESDVFIDGQRQPDRQREDDADSLAQAVDVAPSADVLA